MKKILFVTAILALLSACTKDYSCECQLGDESYIYDLKDVKKKDADEACDLAGEVWIDTGGKCTAIAL